MKPKKQGLGRGLDAILVDSAVAEPSDGITMLRIGEVEPNSAQPRKNFNHAELETLAESLSQYGMIQPITVRRMDSIFQIITGERRWRAARMAGLSEIPAMILNVDDKKAAELALIENIQRSDLNPIEEALGFASLIEEYGLTQEEVSSRIGKSRTAITHALRLLALPEEVKALLADGSLSVGHAKVLLSLADAEKIKDAAAQIIARGLSVRETEVLVKKLLAPTVEKEVVVHDVDHTRALELRVQKQLGRTVKISEKGNHHTISIGYSDNRDLEKILTLLCGENFVETL